MSAWIVTKGHIDVIVQAMLVEGIVALGDADQVGRLLWEENRYSVAVRYPNDADGEWPGPIGLTEAEVAAYTFTGVEAPLADGAVLAAIHCLHYQCAEWEGFDDTPGMVMVATLRRIIRERHGLGPDDDDHDLWSPWPWGFVSITEAVAA